MLPLRLFTRRGFRTGTVVGLLINLGFYGQLFVMSLYFQDVRGYSALRTGLALLPEAALLTIASAVSGRLMARTGPRVPMLTGLLLGGAGLRAGCWAWPSSARWSPPGPPSSAGCGMG